MNVNVNVNPYSFPYPMCSFFCTWDMEMNMDSCSRSFFIRTSITLPSPTHIPSPSASHNPQPQTTTRLIQVF